MSFESTNLDGSISSNANVVMGGGSGGVTSLTTQCWEYASSKNINEGELFLDSFNIYISKVSSNGTDMTWWGNVLENNDLLMLTSNDDPDNFQSEIMFIDINNNENINTNTNTNTLTYKLRGNKKNTKFTNSTTPNVCLSFFKNTLSTSVSGEQLPLPGLKITGETTITGDMTISGETTTITGDTNITGVVGVSGGLDLTGAMTIKKTGTSYLQEFVFSISYEIFENAPKTRETFKEQFKIRYSSIMGISAELITVKSLSKGSTKVTFTIMGKKPNKEAFKSESDSKTFFTDGDITTINTQYENESGDKKINTKDFQLVYNVETYFQAEYLVEEPYFSITQGTKLNENLFAVDNCGNIIINNKGKISYKDKGYTDPSSNKTVGEITFFDNSNSTPEKARITNNYVNDASQTLLELMMEQPRRFAHGSNTPNTDKINLVWNLDHLYPKIFSTNANGSRNLATGFGVSSAFNVLPQITKINVEIQDASTSTNDPSWNPLFYIDQSHNINSKSLYDTSINIFDISSNENRSYYDDNIFYLDQICVNPTIDSTNSNILVNSSSSPSQDSSGVKILKTKFYNSKNKSHDVSFNIRIYGVNNSFLPPDCSNNAIYYDNLAFLTFNEPSGVSITHIGNCFISSANSSFRLLKTNNIQDISLNVKEIEKDSDESTFFINKVDISYSSFASCRAQQSFVDNSNSYNVTETSNSKFPDNRKDNSTNVFLDISSSLHPINLFWATKYNIAARVYNNSSTEAASDFTIKDISQIYTAIPGNKTNYTRTPSFEVIPNKRDSTELLVITNNSNILQSKLNGIHYANHPKGDNSSNIILHFTNLKYELTQFSATDLSYIPINCKNIGNDVSKNKTLGTLRLIISNEHIHLNKTICDISFIVNDFSNNEFDVSYCKNYISGINSSDGGDVIRDIFSDNPKKTGIRLGADINSITIKNIKDSSNIYTVDLSYNTNLNSPPSGQDWSGNIDFIVDTHIEDPSLKSGVSGFSKTPKNYTKLLKQPHGHIFGISNEDISFNDISFTLKHINTKNKYLKRFDASNAEIGKIQIKSTPVFNDLALNLPSTIILPKNDISSNGEYDVSTNNTTLFDPSFLPTKRHVVTDTFKETLNNYSSLTVNLIINGTNLAKSKIVDTSSYTIYLHSDETSLLTGNFPAASSASSGNIYRVDTNISMDTTLATLYSHLSKCIRDNSYTEHSKPVGAYSLRYQGGDYVYKTNSVDDQEPGGVSSDPLIRWMVFDLNYLNSHHRHITNVINNLQNQKIPPRNTPPWSNISKAYVFYFDNDGNIRIGDILSTTSDNDIVDAERWFMKDSNKTTNTLNDSVSIKTQHTMSDTADEKITNAGLSTGLTDNIGTDTPHKLYFLFGIKKPNL